MFRAGLYARVSSNDQQTLAMQIRAIAGVAIPLVIAAALWTGYILWAKSYLSPAY
jgi:hypothetical protein